MKKLLTLIAILSLLIIPFSAMAVETKEIQPLPEYSLEGRTPDMVVYQVWDSRYQTFMDLAPSQVEGETRPIAKMEVFILDRNGDNIQDLVVTIIHLPEVYIEGPEGVKKLYNPACDAGIYMVDDDLDGFWDRMLMDIFDSEGNKGMDNIIDQEMMLPAGSTPCEQM